ncbi:hypothetical protein ACFVVU_23580 [Kitasatospora sp. NPDC057965]|uniref:hypothetical protein n=1 Tax=Kitasatospora sp. NPDC057965 TaxID=3346291 RepID=UPI0036DB79F9
MHAPAARTTITADYLGWLLVQPGPTILSTALSTLMATATGQAPRCVPAANDGTWHHTIPADDLPVLRAWLDRLVDGELVRIGTAVLADGTGTLLTLRSGAACLRLHHCPADNQPVAA